MIEERLDGQEASVLAITDGQTIVTLQPAQDHKAAFDGDTGPNTGGMGAYCPAPLVDDEMLHWIEEHILVPTVHAMKRARRPFRGVLYAGLMMTKQGPEGAGIQRPLRRSRVPAAADAAEDRPGGRAGGDRRGAARPDRAAGVGPAAGRLRGDGQPGLSRRLHQGPSDPRPGRRRLAARREGLSRRHGAARTAAWSRPAAAC